MSSQTQRVQEILLLNKRSGIPIFSRVYKQTSGKDPALVAGLMAAIVQFGEMIGNDMDLNDIGIREGSRIFVRTYQDLVCLLIIENFPVSLVTTRKFVEIINELSSRIFETIRMMITLPNLESNNSIDSINCLISDESYQGQTLSILPGLGSIIDNIVLETTALFYEDEDMLNRTLDALIENELEIMEEKNSTYLKSVYSGTTQEIERKKTSNLRNYFSIFTNYEKEKGD